MQLIQLSQMEVFEIPSTSVTPDAQWDAVQMKQLLEIALQSLPESARRVYEMRDIENQPGEKVAHALGISPAAKKSRLHRARVLLREKMDGYLEGM